MKLCIDCKHEVNFNCHRNFKPEDQKFSPVTGSPVRKSMFFPPMCYHERTSLIPVPWKCGKSGKFFEPKQLGAFMRFCKDCKFESYRICHRKVKQEFDIVSGTLTSLERLENCTDERKSILPWKCGRKARFFQQKEAE